MLAGITNAGAKLMSGDAFILGGKYWSLVPAMHMLEYPGLLGEHAYVALLHDFKSEFLTMHCSLGRVSHNLKAHREYCSWTKSRLACTRGSPMPDAFWHC